MNIMHWQPVVTCRGVVGDRLIEQALRFQATFSCPVCKKDNVIETTGHLFSPLDFSRNLAYETRDLLKARECEYCGVVSAVPSDKRESFALGAKMRVTKTFLEEEIARIIEEYKKK